MAEVKEPIVQQEQEAWWGKKEKKLITDPLFDNNPITVQILGVCSALAVTTLTFKAFIMAVSVTLVTAFSNLATSLVRKYIPFQVRMIAQLVIIAFLVTVVELALKAMQYPMWKDLSVFIGLIITNCIVMGRLEAYAMANKPWKSFLDGIGNGLGYGAVLLALGIVREIFGKGTLMAGSPWEMKIIGPGNGFWIDTMTNSWFSWYLPNNLMVLPASALFLIGIIIWIQRSMQPKLVDVS
ncbi:MAG: NADH:ubiquinone reductase (Na(+)-transporting) subunit D [Saprospiraceae bacterium]|nr:NADH:ubiquinone reductase (Na(+)-transporting) subunit D [Saprospiraceae bacterium]